MKNFNKGIAAKNAKENQVVISVETYKGFEIEIENVNYQIVKVTVRNKECFTDENLDKVFDCAGMSKDAIRNMVLDYCLLARKQHISLNEKYTASNGNQVKIVKRNGGYFAEDANGNQYRIYSKAWSPAFRVIPSVSLTEKDFIEYGGDYVWYMFGENIITISPKDIIR